MNEPTSPPRPRSPYLAYGLVVLHVAGALKHQFISNDDVVARMIPFLRRGRASIKAA